jgi:beta-fructofuranosidase
MRRSRDGSLGQQLRTEARPRRAAPTGQSTGSAASAATTYFTGSSSHRHARAVATYSVEVITDAPPARPRPRLHFTAQRGWTNDPHGIVRVDRRWHLFFQYNPAGLTWDPACHWGHAVSDDLIGWREVDVALSPGPGEIGCWSGSAVVTEAGPVIAYTRALKGDGHHRGAVALARPGTPGDLERPWHSEPGLVVSDAPAECGVTGFRDPALRPQGTGWTAVVGAGLTGGIGAALHYSVSADLALWTLDGVLASRPGTATDPLTTGAFWECPQLVEVDGVAVLLVSTWVDSPQRVVAAIGHYDGRCFEPSRWLPYSRDDLQYATTTWTDLTGRTCAMSWVREVGGVAPLGSSWCGAMSLPHVLSVVDGRLVVTQHPDLDSHLPHVLFDGFVRPGSGGAVRVHGRDARPWRVQADLDGTTVVRVTVAQVQATGTQSAFSILAEPETGVRLVDASGAELAAIPTTAAAPGGTLDVVVDADLVEVSWTGGEGIAVLRLPVVTDAELTVSAGGAAVRARLTEGTDAQ